MKAKTKNQSWTILEPVDNIPDISSHKYPEIHKKLLEMKAANKWLPVKCNSTEECVKIGRRFSGDGYKYKIRGTVLYIFSSHISTRQVLTSERVVQKIKR